MKNYNLIYFHKIKTLDELQNLSIFKKTVCSFNLKPIPAICVLNMTGRTILKLIKEGLYIYESKETTRRRNK